MFYTAIEALTIGISERECAVRNHLYQPRSAAVRHALHHRGQRSECGPVFSGSACAFEHHGKPSGRESSTGRSSNPSAACRTIATNNKIPYTEEYMFSIERGFGNNTVLDVSYVGTQAHHLLVLEEANPGQPGALSAAQQSGQSGARPNSLRPIQRKQRFHHRIGPGDQWNQRAAGAEFRKRHLRDHHRQLQLQLAASDVAPYQRAAAVAGGIHLQQVAGSIFQSGRRGEPAQSFAQQGVVGLRYHAQLRRELQLPASVRNVCSVPPTAGRKGWEFSGITRFSSGFP